MKQMDLLWASTVVVFISLNSASFGANADPSASKAVFEASKEFGIRLSDPARKTIELSTSPINSEGTHFAPESSLVHHQDKIGVYRLRNGWFKLIDVEGTQRASTGFIIRTNEIKRGDELVTHGTALLRVADMEAFSSGE